VYAYPELLGSLDEAGLREIAAICTATADDLRDLSDDPESTIGS
jgi:hypothetical protein